MDLTVCRKQNLFHKKTRSGSFVYKPACLNKIDCSDVTSKIKSSLFCFSSKFQQTPLSPRRSILEVSEVKKIAEQSADKSKLKRVKSRIVATINLNTKETNCYETENLRKQGKEKKKRKVIRRSISISESLLSYDKITPVQSTPKSSFNILKEINLKQCSNSNMSQSTVKHKIIRPSFNLQEKPKRCIKIVTTSKKNEDREKCEGMYYTFSPYERQTAQTSRF